MKKIFIISPHFPPSALPPSQRVRLLVKHLHNHGWEPTVFTVDHKYREELADPWMVELAGKNYKIIWVNCLSQKKMRKLGIGDLGLRMIPFLIGKLIRHAKKEKPDFILYPVPPWYLMTIAPIVKWFTGVPYGIDFIDPWVREILPSDNMKAKISQRIARLFEGFSVRKSSALFAVSEGIIKDIRTRYPKAVNIPAAAVAYGVEFSDYDQVQVAKKDAGDTRLIVRYIGALSDSMLDVVRILLLAFKTIHDSSIYIEFIGTSYAGGGLAKGRIQHLITEFSLEDQVKEFPDRVSYKEALHLNMSSDILLLVGDMTPYYAASKLMGLVASQKPFIAFLHRESFPARFLKELKYPYVVEYGAQPGNLPEQHLQDLVTTIRRLKNELHQFTPVSKNHPAFLEHTASQMSKVFISTIEKI